MASSTTQKAAATNGDRKVIRLFPRALRPDPGPVRWDPMRDSPIAGMERYERGSESEEDYRHRMLENLLAAIVVMALVITGTWIVDRIAQTTQDGHNIARTAQDASAAAFIRRTRTAP